jgi:hypothetical protein
MDGSHFDSLTRQITTRLSRRTSVARLAALGLLGLRPPQESTAKKQGGKKKRKACPPCKKRKNGKCKGTQPDGTACTITGGGAGTCQSGSCLAAPPQRVAPVPAPPAPPPPPPSPGCPEGTTACGGACVNTRTDPTNCGTCGTHCRVNESCIDGVCACSSSNAGICPTGFTCCLPQFGGGCACGSSPTFIDPATCDDVATCPTNTIACSGAPGTCRTCCPAGTTCDTATGACVQ